MAVAVSSPSVASAAAASSAGTTTFVIASAIIDGDNTSFACCVGGRMIGTTAGIGGTFPQKELPHAPILL